MSIMTSSATTLPVNWTATYPLPAYSPPAKPEPEPEPPLAWLDREIECTCALARAAL